MRVLYTTAARADLAEIEDFIRRDNPIRAETFTEELVAACEALAEMPFAAPVVPRYSRLEYRRKVHKRYLIFYRVKAKTLEIVRVLQGSRNYPRLLSRDHR